MSEVVFLRASPSGARCRLGVVLVDYYGCRFGLSAFHILQKSETGQVWDEAGTILGQVQRHNPSPLVESRSAQFHELIGRFAIDPSRALTPDNCRALSSGSISPGRLLFWRAADESVQRFEVVGRGGEIAFSANPGDDPVYFTDPVVLQLEQGSKPAPGAGDAGSPLLDADGNVAALLMSFDGERYYAAAVAEYAASAGLRPLTASRLLPSPEPRDDASSTGEFFEGQIAVENLYADLKLKRAVHADPGGDEVPAELLLELEGLPG